MILKRRGVKIFTGARVERIEQAEGGLACTFSGRGLLSRDHRRHMQSLRRRHMRKLDIALHHITDRINPLLASVIRPHPTFNEAVTEAVEDVLGHAVHAAPKRR